MELASWNHINGRPHEHKAGQRFHVPVGEAKAPVGLGAPDLLGNRGSVDAVAGFVESDPDGAHRIVGAWGNEEFAAYSAGFLGFRKVFRVEHVIWIGNDKDHVEAAHRSFFDQVGDAAREVDEEVGAGVENLERTSGKADPNKRRGGIVRGGGDVGNPQGGVWRNGGPIDNSLMKAGWLQDFSATSSRMVS